MFLNSQFICAVYMWMDETTQELCACDDKFSKKRVAKGLCVTRDQGKKSVRET